MDSLIQLDNCNVVNTLYDSNCSEVFEKGIGKSLKNQHDVLSVLIQNAHFNNDLTSYLGPDKFSDYTGSGLSSKLQQGCKQCGASLNIRYAHQLNDAQYFVCEVCGHKITKIRFSGDTDNLVDHYKPADQSKRSCGIYYRSYREYCIFNEQEKDWWKSLLATDHDDSKIESQLAAHRSSMKSSKGQIVQETCDKCGHHEAYYTSFQARSADEGMTVLYECCKCSARRTLNT